MLDINFNESWNELDKLNEAPKSMSYANVKYLLDNYPNLTNDADKSLLNIAKSIEQAIPPTKSDAPRGLRRVCYFYNAHAIEVATKDSAEVKKLVVNYLIWRLNNQLDDMKENDDLINKVNIVLADHSHNDFHPGRGRNAADLRSYVNANYNWSNRVDIELKITYSGNISLDDKNVYGADIVLVLDFYSNKIYSFFNSGTKDSPEYKRGNSVLDNYANNLLDPNAYPSDWDVTYKEIDTYEHEFLDRWAEEEKNREFSEFLEAIDPTTKFDKPWDLDKIPDQDFIDAGLDKKDYVDQAWAAWRNKKMGNVEYVSKAASNETARKKAEDDYNYALKKLGAVRRYPNKYGRGSYDAPEGVFDLDNFHVAFDKWFEDHGLMKLFDKEGKLKMKGSWGDISKLDKNEAPAKALIELWRAQYSGGKTFKSAWDAEQQKKQAEQQAAKLRKDWEDQEDKDAKDLEEEIKKAILNSVDWINLKKVYASNSKEAADKLDVDVEVWTRGYQEDQAKIKDSRVVKIWFKNMIGPDTEQFEALCEPNVDPLKISDSVDVIVKQLNSVLTDLADSYYYLAELGSSWIAFTRSKTYEALGDDWRSIMFFNPADKKFYKITKKRVVSMSKDRSNSWSYSNIKSSYDDIPYLLLTYDIDGETRNYDVEYDISWEPVYACIKFSSDGNGNYKHWESANAEYVFNLKYGTDILDKAGMRFYKPISNSIETCEIENASAPYNIAFEKSSKYSYFLDSSD